MRAGWARVFFSSGNFKGVGCLGFFWFEKKMLFKLILLLHVLTPNNDEMVFPDGSELGLFPLMNTLFDMVCLCFSVCLKPFYY